MSTVEYENLIAIGRFENDPGDIETVVVPANATVKRGTVLGKATASGSYATSHAIKYATTGSTQSVTTVIGEVVHFAVASSGAGTGTIGNFYQALTVQASVDLDLETFATDTVNWLDLGAIIGSETAQTVLEKEIVNATASIVNVKEVVNKKGTFNTLGVTFGNGQTRENTQDDLHLVSIEITKGEA